MWDAQNKEMASLCTSSKPCAPSQNQSQAVSSHRNPFFPKAVKTKFFLSSGSPSFPHRARRVRILLKEAKSKKPLVISIAPSVT